MIELHSTVFGYPTAKVAGPIDHSLAPGEVVAIVGPSGCGKTTILKTIAGDLPLLRGEIRLDGQRQDREWIAANLSRTLQSFPLFHWLTVEGNLRLAAKLRGIKEIDIDRVLGAFSALHLKDRFPKTLSGGERCRASLSQATLIEPRVLLLDEPFSGLDFQVKEGIARNLFSFAQQRETSVLFVTHDIHDACEYAARILVLTVESGVSQLRAVVPAEDDDALIQVRTHLLRGNGAEARVGQPC